MADQEDALGDQHCPHLAAQDDYVPTASRVPFVGWLRNYGQGWNGLTKWRMWKAWDLIHERQRKDG